MRNWKQRHRKALWSWIDRMDHLCCTLNDRVHNNTSPNWLYLDSSMTKHFHWFSQWFCLYLFFLVKVCLLYEMKWKKKPHNQPMSNGAFIFCLILPNNLAPARHHRFTKSGESWTFAKPLIQRLDANSTVKEVTVTLPWETTLVTYLLINNSVCVWLFLML